MTIIGHSYSLVKSSTKCAPALEKLSSNELGYFDIGHVVTQVEKNEGDAHLGSLCDNIDLYYSYRSNAATGNKNPVGDAFFIDFVAHEIGHQFGAHVQNLKRQAN